MLTGGLIHGSQSRGEAIGRSVDWLTGTVPVHVGQVLTAQSEVYEPGFARHGFRLSEQRAVLGGVAWRRWDPTQASEQWGTAYESWEFPSDSARWGASFLRGRDCRPSRVDVAWDYQVPESFTPDDLVQLIAPHVADRGLTLGISGQDGRNTRYVGSASSKRRIRVYRKDWQQPMWLFGPTLRVELVMRHEQAQAWWRVWDRDEDAGYAAAAGHVLDMAGVEVQQAGPVPELEPVEGADEAGELFQFLEQHGPRLLAWHEAKVPLLKLARLRVRQASRMTQYRMNRLQKRVERVGASVVTALVRDRLVGQGE